MYRFPGFLILPVQVMASGAALELATKNEVLDLTSSNIGFASLAIFVIAYLLVMSEEFTHLRKSKPVIIAAGIIWAMIGAVYMSHGIPELAEHAVRHNLLEYAELMLF